MQSKQDLLANSLKEWAIATSVLAAGDTIMLLRKGGIRESNKHFQIQYDRFWLYPTYEHQKPQLLKPKYSDRVKIVESGWHPETVDIISYAETTNVLKITEETVLDKLEPFYIWSRETISDRFKWKPQQPLTLLLLRVFNLSQPVTIAYHQSYGGCKSWINLQNPLSTKDVIPALSLEEYQQRVREIIEIVE